MPKQSLTKRTMVRIYNKMAVRWQQLCYIQQMLDVALLSSTPNFPFLLLNCTEAVPSRHLRSQRGLPSR